MKKTDRRAELLTMIDSLSASQLDSLHRFALFIKGIHEPGTLSSIEGMIGLLLNPDALTSKLGAPRSRDRKASKRRRPGAIYQLKVTLKGSKPPIWRRILVGGETTLAELHDILQVAMGWSDQHLHAFHIGDIEYGPNEPDPDPFFASSAEDESGVRLDEVAGSGTTFRYDYDFGDDWEHQITVEKALPPDSGEPHPRCLAGKGACPPEDSGGIRGYYRKLEVLKHPEDPEYEEIADWMDPEFDPEHFDPEEANHLLSSIHRAARKH